MHGFTSWLSQLDFSMLWDYVVIVAASLLCIMFHEVCHGLTALKLGDTTAKDAGRLTFNPIKHIDAWGLLMMAVFKFGWAKAVPVDMRRFRHPVRDMAITAAAGPLSNVLLAFLALCACGGVVCEFAHRRCCLRFLGDVFSVCGDPQCRLGCIQRDPDPALGRVQGPGGFFAAEGLLSRTAV